MLAEEREDPSLERWKRNLSDHREWPGQPRASTLNPHDDGLLPRHTFIVAVPAEGDDVRLGFLGV